MSFLTNFQVVPKFDSNLRLQQQIVAELEDSLEVRNYNGPPPKIVVFRPTGRPADEFKEAVYLILEKSSSVYLVVAFSGQYKDITELVPVDLRDRVVTTVYIFIQAGQLVGKDSPNYNSNQQQLDDLARQLSKDYSVEQDQASVPPTSDSSSVDFCLSPADAKLLGRAVVLLGEFPQGVCLTELLAMMMLDASESDAMQSVLRMTSSVFTCEGAGEREEIVKLTDSHLNYLTMVRSGALYKEATSRQSQTGGRGMESVQTPRKILITTSHVAQFVEAARQSPSLLDPRLTSLIQGELHIEDQLVDRLANIVSAIRHGCSSSDLNLSCSQISPAVFLTFVESGSVELQEELKQSLEREFRITYRDLMSGLRTVCGRLREEMREGK